MNHIQSTISRLKFLSRIGHNEKLHINPPFVQPNTWITKISRSVWNVDNRGNTVSFIRKVIYDSFKILENDDLNILIRESMIESLRECLIGIQNLKNTYCDDIKIGCDLDTLKNRVEIFLKEIDEENLLNIEGTSLINNEKIITKENLNEK